jgi:putative DNA primase/helicase
MTFNGNEISRARSALFFLDAGCDRDTWVKLLMSAKAAGLTVEDAIEWSSSAGNYGGERQVREVWRGIKAGAVGVGTLFYTARANGWRDDGQYFDVPVRPRPVEPIEQPKPAVIEIGKLKYFERLGPVRDVGMQYLRARCCVIPPVDSDLRYDPACEHPSGYVGPALVGLITDAITNTPISLHTTWVTPGRDKAPVDPPRRYLPGHRKSGGVVRLWSNESVTYGLAIAEGIETALTAAHAFRPAWATLDAGNLKNFPVLPGIESLTVAVDQDAAGESAFEAVKATWKAAGRNVYPLRGRHGA